MFQCHGMFCGWRRATTLEHRLKIHFPAGIFQVRWASILCNVPWYLTVFVPSWFQLFPGAELYKGRSHANARPGLSNGWEKDSTQTYTSSVPLQQSMPMVLWAAQQVVGLVEQRKWSFASAHWWGGCRWSTGSSSGLPRYHGVLPSPTWYLFPVELPKQ